MSHARVTSAPASLQTVAERVERRLRVLLDAETQRWHEVDATLDELFRSLSRLVLSGGKRLRPAFCTWGFVGAGRDPSDPAVVDAGAALELLQAFALVHDDVMDGSALRRGRRTVHLDYGARHAVADWRGEARRFGEGVAILVGDFAHVYADMLLTGAPLEAATVWNELRIELNAGQFLDVMGTAQRETDYAVARRIARYKSGKYTIERPLHLGAALAGRFAELSAALSAYGDPLGEAFQLRDDILGAFGDSDATGKPVGDDLREGKPTPLLAVAIQRATAAQREALTAIGNPELSAADVRALQSILVDTGAVDTIEATIDDLTTRAIGALDGAPITAEARDALADLARYVAWREA